MAIWKWVLGASVAGAVAIVARKLLASSSRATVAPGARRVLVLGDSITVGYLPKLKAILTKDAVYGEGWTGKQVNYIHEHGAKYFAEQPTHVVVLAGINNVASGHSAEKAAEQLLRLWADAKRTGARLVAVTLLPCPRHKVCGSEKVANERAKLNQFIRKVQGMPGGPDVVLDTETFDVGLLAGDGLHPTGAGQARLAAMVAAVL